MKFKATLITLQDEPPHWTSDSDMGLESISEPDIDMPEDDEDELERFSSERSPSASPDTSVSAQDGVAAKSEVDTEEDPIDPITPGPGKGSFDIIESPQKKEDLTVNVSRGANESLTFDDEEDEDEEWVDPSEFTPQTPSPGWHIPSLPPSDPPSQSQSTHSQHPFLQAPPMTESRSSSSAMSRQSSSGSSKPRERRKPKKSTSSSGHTVMTRTRSSSQDQQQYPFPATAPGDEEDIPIGRSMGKGIPQMRTAKARDGGRTQSGGVRGVPTDDGDDF